MNKKFYREGYRGKKLIGTVIIDTLYKWGLSDERHLLWKCPFLGSPAIDANMYDEVKSHIKRIYIRTQTGKRFKVSVDVFNAHKIRVNLGYYPQYAMPYKYWDIVPEEMGQKKLRIPTKISLAELENEGGDNQDLTKNPECAKLPL